MHHLVWQQIVWQNKKDLGGEQTSLSKTDLTSYNVKVNSHNQLLLCQISYTKKNAGIAKMGHLTFRPRNKLSICLKTKNNNNNYKTQNKNNNSKNALQAQNVGSSSNDDFIHILESISFEVMRTWN